MFILNSSFMILFIYIFRWHSIKMKKFETNGKNLSKKGVIFLDILILNFSGFFKNLFLIFKNISDL